MDAPTADEVADDFFDALAAADEWRTVDLAVGLSSAGMPVEEVLLDVVAPAQERVGLLWQSGAWSVAREHAATAINERVIAAVAEPRAGAAAHGHVVLSCLPGEPHALPARLVSEVLRRHGWRVTFLGADVPSGELVSYLAEQEPDVVALSCMMSMHLPGAQRTVTAAQARGTRVLAGGPGFGPAGRWAHAMGVDGYAGTATDALAVLAEGRWAADRIVVPSAGDAEHTALLDLRHRLVRDAMHALVVSPAVAGPADLPEPENVAQLVDVLAAAVQLCDRELLAEHLRWLDVLLVARTGSAAGVLTALDAFDAALPEFPIAQDCIDYGRVVLRAAEAER